MRTSSVELVCRSCGITAELPLAPGELRAVHCEGCGREMFFHLEDVAEEPVDLDMESVEA